MAFRMLPQPMRPPSLGAPAPFPFSSARGRRRHGAQAPRRELRLPDTKLPPNSDPISLVIADFDGNGIPDLAIANAGTLLTVPSTSWSGKATAPSSSETMSTTRFRSRSQRATFSVMGRLTWSSRSSSVTTWNSFGMSTVGMSTLRSVLPRWLQRREAQPHWWRICKAMGPLM